MDKELQDFSSASSSSSSSSAPSSAGSKRKRSQSTESVSKSNDGISLDAKVPSWVGEMSPGEQQEDDADDGVEEESESSVANAKTGHLFTKKTLTRPSYCSFCKHFVFGLRKQCYECEYCGYLAHDKCKDSVEAGCYHAQLAPHPSGSNEISFHHHWIAGNVDKEKCIVCSSYVSTSSGGFKALKCSKCSAHIHEACMDDHEMQAKGDFCKPKHKDLIFCRELIAKLVANSPSTPPSYRPLLVFVNSKSGGQQGDSLLSKLRSLLTTEQVVDLFEDPDNVGPRKGLEAYANVPNMHILVCGGDGTAGWVLSELLDKGRFHFESGSPPMAVLPLGTGNDLARVLQWGGGYTGEPLSPILSRIGLSVPVGLDRWDLSINSADETFSKNYVLNNYFSLGMDAQIALQFHNLREENPNMFKSRTINKGIYGVFGFQTLINQPKELEELGVKINVDGTDVDVPNSTKLKCLIFLNIPSYAGGSDLWAVSDSSSSSSSSSSSPSAPPSPSSSSSSLVTAPPSPPVSSSSSTLLPPSSSSSSLSSSSGAILDRFSPCQMNDGVIEIVGMRDVTHLLALQAKISHGDRIAQGRNIRLTITEPCCVQVDGEPFKLPANTTVDIKLKNQATMLKRQRKKK